MQPVELYSSNTGTAALDRPVIHTTPQNVLQFMWSSVVLFVYVMLIVLIFTIAMAPMLVLDLLLGTSSVSRNVMGGILSRLGNYFSDHIKDRCRNIFNFRRPVLFLRAHADDGLIIAKDNRYSGRTYAKPFAWSRDDVIPFEELLARRLQRIGPLVALRTSYEVEEPFTFRRYLIDEAIWHRQILFWIRHARLVVIQIGPVANLTDRRFGLGWEISTVLAMNCPHKVLIVLPPVEQFEREQRWKAYKRLVNEECGGSDLFPTTSNNDLPVLFATCGVGWKHTYEAAGPASASTYDSAIGSVIRVRPAYWRWIGLAILIGSAIAGLLLFLWRR